MIELETRAKIKFKVEFVSRDIPKNSNIPKLTKWGKIFHSLGLAPSYDGSFGNLSSRTLNGFIITATKSKLEQLTPEDFVEIINCDLDGGKVYARGIKNPSSETLLHCAIYTERRDVGAILHGHCDKIVNADYPWLVYTEREAPAGSIDLVKEVLKVLNNHNFIVLKKHGFISLGRDIDKAGETVLEVLKKINE